MFWKKSKTKLEYEEMTAKAVAEATAELSQRMDKLQVDLTAALQRSSQQHKPDGMPPRAPQNSEPDHDEPTNSVAENYGKRQLPERANVWDRLPTPEDTPPLNRIRPRPKQEQEDDIVYLQPADEEGRMRVQYLPEFCEVKDQRVQDPKLREDYSRLPNLRVGEFICYYDRSYEIAPKGFPYSDWSNNDIYRLLRPAINFEISGRYVNPSRVDPRKLSALRTSSSSERYKLQADVGRGQFKDAVCISPIYTIQSSFVSASPGTLDSVEYKYVNGLLHTQEWERMMATMCMAFDKSILQADLKSENIISFSTPPVRRGSTAGVPPNVVTYEKFALSCGDEIPVYDATGLASLPLNEGYLDGLRLSTLPRWRTEIPLGSCAIVAYSAACFYKNNIPGQNKWKLYTNIKWVIILGRKSNPTNYAEM
ncbi:hypothetical protein BDQ17DRAFT_1429746 [Cyathus striatus]|nr:hypothetical protein BDQ17DRAFT_1429746 [Cyathus striatus]